MAEQTKEKKEANGNEDGGSQALIILGVIAIVLVIGAFLWQRGLLSTSETEPTPTPTVTPAPTVDLTAEKLAKFEGVAAVVRQIVDEDLKTDVDKVVVYVKANPAVLDNPASAPDDIKAAYQRIEKNLESIGTQVDSKALTTSPTTTASPKPTFVYPKGEKLTIEGVLLEEKVEKPFGGLYTVNNKTDGITYYLWVSDEAVKEIDKQDMVGQEVKVKVEFTDNYGGLKILSGPMLVSN